MHKINAAFITDRMILGHGVDLVIDKIATGLSQSGYECKIYCNHFNESFKKQRPYKIRKLPAVTTCRSFIPGSKLKKIKLFLNNEGADIFIINSFPFYKLAGYLNKPVISINYGVISTEGLPLKRKLFYKYMDFTQNFFYFKKSSEIISISNYLHMKLPAYLRKKADYILLGANHYRDKEISKQQINKFRDELGVKDDDCLLLYVGRLNPVNQPYKGTQELINLFHDANRQNSKIKLLMVGFGSQNDEIAIKNEGVLAISNAPWEMMPLIYSSCDIYATCTKWEGFDLPVVEAQTFGKPVICYNLCAHPEITENNVTGFLVNTREEFLGRMLLLSPDKNLRNEMGLTCLEFSKNFTWEKTVSRYDSKIRSLLAGSTGKKELTTSVSKSDEEYNKTLNQTEIFKKEKSLEPDVTVLIINYNSSLACLKECLDSLKSQTYKNINILIFDNGSTNDTIDILSRELHENRNLKNTIISDEDNKIAEVKIMKNDKNDGLGKAINLAVEKIDTPYVLISNFDVVYDRNCLQEFVLMMNTCEEDVAGLAPKIKLAYQKDYIESVGTYLDSSLYDGYQGLGQLDLHQYDVSENIFGVSFTSAFMKTDAFKDSMIGKVDETFFLFYGDFDFCFRANLKGYKFKTCPKSVVYHKYAYSFREESTAFETKYYYKRLNLLKMMFKNADQSTINRLLPIETNIMKQNLRDRNLRKVSKRILADLRKSKKYLLCQREIIQMEKIVSEAEIIKFCWGEHSFFDVVRNEPKYEIANLERSYQRLYVITGSNKYLEYISYLHHISYTKFKFEKETLKHKLHSKLENEPASVHEFIDRL